MKLFLFFVITLFMVFSFSAVSQEKIKSKEKNIKIKNMSENKDQNDYLKSDSTQEAELTLISKNWMDAILSHDSIALEALMASEYTLRKGDGTVVMPRAGWLNNLFHNLTITRFEQTNVSTQVHGDVGIVTSTYSWAGTFGTNPFDSKGYLTDVWVRRNNHWQVVTRTSGLFEGSKRMDGK